MSSNAAGVASRGRCARLLALTVALRGVQAEPGGNCSLTSRPPRQARYLKFCQDYNTEACCIPGHDLENQAQFENLIDGLGPGCKNPMMYPHIRYFYCLGCDPLQPKYTFGDNINICKSFLDTLWRDPTYDECGVMYSNPCPSSWGDDEDFDPYQCGDTLVLPKAEYKNNVTAFINAFKPPGLDGYTFFLIDDIANPDARGSCWSAPAFTSDATRVGSRLLTTVAIMAFGMAARSWL